MKKTDEYINLLITKYLENTATEKDVEQLRLWIEEREENKKYFFEVREIWLNSNVATQYNDIHLPLEEKRMWHKISLLSIKPKSILYYFYRVAAVLFLPLLCIAGYLLWTQESKKATLTLQEIVAPAGGQTKIDLPDGSEVWLNSGSKLMFGVPMDKRSVKLSGEGYFKVQSDSDNPFTVDVKAARIKVTGTEFNVTAFESDTTTSVTLVKGKVDVKVKGYKNIALGEGERIEIYDTQIKRQANSNLYKWCAWKDGVLVFRDDRLDYVFQRIERTYNVNIIIQDKEISSYLYRATFKDESLEQILALLKLSAPINYKWLERTKTDNFYDKQTIVVMKKGRGQ